MRPPRASSSREIHGASRDHYVSAEALGRLAIVGPVLSNLGCGEQPQPPEDLVRETSALYQTLGNCPAFDDYSACLCTGLNRFGSCWIYSSTRHIYPVAGAAPTGFPNDSFWEGRILH
jgi:hypothetical protein